MLPTLRPSFVSMVMISLLLACATFCENLPAQAAMYSQTTWEERISGPAASLIAKLPPKSSASILRLLLDMGRKEEVVQGLKALSESDAANSLEKLIYEAGYHGSLPSLEFVLDQTPVEKRNKAKLQCAVSLANGKHFELAKTFIDNHFDPTSKLEAAQQVARYALIFGETEMCRMLLDNTPIDELLRNTASANQRYMLAKQFDATLGIDFIWSSMLYAYRAKGTQAVLTHSDLLSYLAKNDELDSDRVRAVFVSCAARKKSSSNNGGSKEIAFETYKLFKQLLEAGTDDLKSEWHGEQLFLAMKFNERDFILQEAAASTNKNKFDLPTSIAAISTANENAAFEIAKSHLPLASDDAFYFALALEKMQLLHNIENLPEVLQVQLVAGLHKQPGIKQHR